MGKHSEKIVKIYFHAFVTGRSESFAAGIHILLDIYCAFLHSSIRAHGINRAKGQNSRRTGVIHKGENIYKSQGPTSSICAAGEGVELFAHRN